ncbi:putative transmembrane GTPase FZO-like, chloroplastic [Vitis vinifera]|uniref:Putative transmembrane GTPase FZO-like, chloroplastic n=1 Tax=Vitis vinifera TaxID=29760 RepID=A0A438F477_VITVI|nr:putative transmembrane GTPase FZO-like, chloroplastic [Vitis vinifera]
MACVPSLCQDKGTLAVACRFVWCSLGASCYIKETLLGWHGSFVGKRHKKVAFLRYTQQWRKKIVFVLNKADLYQNASELEEAVSFIKKNVQKLLNVKHVILYPVSASFLDGSTSTGMERMKLKLETPIGIAERLFSSCETLVRQDYQYAKQDLASINEMVSSVKEYAVKMESENISWRRQTLSLIDTTKARIVKLIDSTLQLSNLDLVGSYVLKGAKSATLPATSSVQMI